MKETKVPIVLTAFAIILAAGGTVWSAYLLLDRILDDVRHTAGEILAPIAIGTITGFIIMAMLMLTFVRSDK